VARLKAKSAAAPRARDASDFDPLPGQIEIDATSQLETLQAARLIRKRNMLMGARPMNAPFPHDVADEVKRLADQWPEEFRLGYRFGSRGKADPPSDAAGYPLGFHTWPLDRRNAWFCGFDRGFVAIDKVTVNAGSAQTTGPPPTPC
jgi:hypothetical protein